MPKIIEHDAQTQAGRILQKFGSATALANALAQVGCHRSVASICRWTYPEGRYKTTHTTGGRIPTSMWPHILKAARLYGIVFTDSELRP
jgi:hypothetical protein